MKYRVNITYSTTIEKIINADTAEHAMDILEKEIKHGAYVDELINNMVRDEGYAVDA